MAGFDLGGTAGALVGGLAGGMGGGGGAWMGQSNYQAAPYQFNPNAFVDPNAEANRQQMLSGLAQANAFQPQQVGAQTVNAQNVGATAVNAQGLDAANQGNQAGLIQQLQQRMLGQGPSVAEQQLRQTTDTQNQSALSMAASAGGGTNPALALRQAQDMQARNNQTAAGQAATLRAGEQLNTAGALTGALGQQQAGQLTSAGLNLTGQQSNQATSLQAAGMNQAANLQAGGMNQQANLAALMANQQAGLNAQGQRINAGLGYNQLMNNQSQTQVANKELLQQLAGQQQLGTSGLNQNTAAANAAATGNAFGGIVGGIGSGIASKLGFAEGGFVGPMADTAALVNRYLNMKSPTPANAGAQMESPLAGIIKGLPGVGAAGPGIQAGEGDLALAAATASTGGEIKGPGGPRDDQVPIAASEGEFVVNAKAAAKYKGTLEKINAWGLKEQDKEDENVAGLLQALHARIAA